MTDPHTTLDVPEELPLLPLREFAVFPYMVLPLLIGRESSIQAVESALAGDRLMLLVAQRDPAVDDPEPDDLYRVGTVAMVMRILRLPDGRVKALLQGLAKAEIESFIEDAPAHRVRVKALPPDPAARWTVQTEALARTVRSHVEELLPLKQLPPEVLSITDNVEDLGRLADLVASNLRLRLSEAQEVFEIRDPATRLRRVDDFLRRELEVSAMQAEIQSQAKDELTRGQRESYLREQLRAIQSELGESDPRADEVGEYEAKLEEAELPPEAHAEAERQLRRLERMHPDGPEAQVVRGYLDWLVELPWARSSPDCLDLEEARRILDADHAHLTRVKDRILEFLGVRKLRRDSRGPILCFVGPPGVGKTSLGRSIARAMGREFVRVSLGGTRDEAEVRGHRRTYVGALPGRIIQGIKQAGTNNPVFMLDEVDKLGHDFRGDPSAALLEVLDPEQNVRFSDHYLNLPFDLSKVFFIATANVLEPVPRPLRDRMEVLPLSGYTPEEKLAIAKDFLIPRQMEESGLPPDRIRWSDAGVMQIITQYTQEAGVRGVEREVAAVCRKMARRAAEGEPRRVTITCRNLSRFLGRPRYEASSAPSPGEVGVCNGLAWTEAGGDVLRVEATFTRGSGLVLTGQLGDVMKESAQAALTFARAWLPGVGVDDALLCRNEVHVHVPAGAVPKDGPSAGVAIAAAIVSLATGVSVRGDLAMTGEVTLRGRVLPVGGVREKALAAHRAGVRSMILPRRNVDDLEDLPREARRRLRLIPVEHMSEVIERALEEPIRGGSRPTRRRRPPVVSGGPVAHARPAGPRAR